MKNYKMEVFPQTAADGSIYWTAKFPTIPGKIVGGGSTVDEAVKEATENLEIYLEYLKDEGLPIPDEFDMRTEYSGKIALRVSKNTHKELISHAADEGISVNMYINNAIERYMGTRDYRHDISKKIDELRSVAGASVELQQVNVMLNQAIWEKVNGESIEVGVYNEQN